jgi:hypothetical protein
LTGMEFEYKRFRMRNIITVNQYNLIGDNKELCITRTVKHNYNSPSSTVRIQLRVSVLYVDHLQVEIF